jgi:hypothetical protein
MAARLLAVSALLLAAYVVAAVVLEARQPRIGTPQVRPAPSARGGQAAAPVNASETRMLALRLPAEGPKPR